MRAGFVSLELLDDRERQVGVEGFTSFTQAACFTLAAIYANQSPFENARAAHHHDMREVRSMLTTAPELARFYVRLGYNDEDVKAGLQEQFPAADHVTVIREAREQFAREEEHLDRSEAETQRRIDLGEFGGAA